MSSGNLSLAHLQLSSRWVCSKADAINKGVKTTRSCGFFEVSNTDRVKCPRSWSALNHDGDPVAVREGVNFWLQGQATQGSLSNAAYPRRRRRHRHFGADRPLPRKGGPRRRTARIGIERHAAPARAARGPRDPGPDASW